MVVCLANVSPIGRNIGDHSARPNYLRFRERFDIRMGGYTAGAAILEARNKFPVAEGINSHFSDLKTSQADTRHELEVRGMLH